jgi:uncharacterized membrane protein YphA (DoxX/SURF4 family)
MTPGKVERQGTNGTTGTTGAQSPGGVGAWASFILRLAIASLFFAAAVPKLKGGWASIHGTADHFQAAFENTWLPKALVTADGYAVPFIEALIPIWLISGFKLKAAWVFTSIYMVSLGFGMIVVQNGDVAAHNYTYVLICVAGLYLSRFDRFGIDAARRPATP